MIYDDLAPWPTGADGNGSSLTRVGATGWGGLASSWTAATPSPGTANITGRIPGDSNGDGRFNQLDIVQVLQANKYLTGQPATFEEGDWNANGFFNQLDIVYALQSGQYQPGAAAALRPSSTHRRPPIAERDLASDNFDSSAELARSLRQAPTQRATDTLFAKLGR